MLFNSNVVIEAPFKTLGKLVERTGADYDDVLITENRNYSFFKEFSGQKMGKSYIMQVDP